MNALGPSLSAHVGIMYPNGRTFVSGLNGVGFWLLGTLIDECQIAMQMQDIIYRGGGRKEPGTWDVRVSRG